MAFIIHREKLKTMLTNIAEWSNVERKRGKWRVGFSGFLCQETIWIEGQGSIQFQIGSRFGWDDVQEFRKDVVRPGFLKRVSGL